MRHAKQVLPDMNNAALPTSIQTPMKQTVAARALFEGGLIYTCMSQLFEERGGPVFDWQETGSQGSLTFEGDVGYGQHEGQSYTWRLEKTILQGVLIRSWRGNDRTDAPWGLYKIEAIVGDNVLSKVNWVQRTDTQGGAIPVVACSQQFLGTRHAVKASALFTFWKDSNF